MTDDKVLKMVEHGPVPVRSLRGHSAAFQLAYRRVLAAGKIVEHGGSDRMDPKYFGLPDAKFPARRLTPQLADICLLRLAGATEDDAKTALKTAIDSGGEDAVASLCETAHNRLLDEGFDPAIVVRTAVNRHRNGLPFRPLSVQYDVANKPLELEPF